MKNGKVRTGRAAALAAALLLSAGCATKHDVRDLRLELLALSTRQDSLLAVLARQNAVTQDTLRSQTDRLFEIRGDVSRQLGRILDELVQLRELTGQNQRTIAALRDQVERLGARSMGAAPAGEAGGGGPPGGVQEAPANAPDNLYNAALAQYQREQLTTALVAFQNFLQQYGGHERAPDARFYVADILEQQGKTQEALDAFNQIPQLHPSAGRVPDALYRAGLLYLELKKKADARRALEKVVNTYPDSPTAALARAKLREIR